MNTQSRKNFKNILGLVLMVTLFASCSRGGYGCPYELSLAADVISGLL